MPAGAYLDEIPRSKPNLTSTTLTRSQVLHLDAQPMAPAEIRRSWRPGCLHHELPRPRQGSEWRHGRSRYPLRSVLRPGHLLDLQVRRLISPRRASLSIADCSPFLFADTGLSWRCVHKSSVLEMAAALTFPSPSSQMDLNSVERAQQYLELPQEPPAIVESNRPPAYWPSSNSENLVRLISSSRGFSG